MYHQLCASGFPHSKIILNYFPLVKMFVLMRGTFLLEEFLFGGKLREIFWKLAFDLGHKYQLGGNWHRKGSISMQTDF